MLDLLEHLSVHRPIVELRRQVLVHEMSGEAAFGLFVLLDLVEQLVDAFSGIDDHVAAHFGLLERVGPNLSGYVLDVREALHLLLLFELNQLV